jgi:DNA-binding NtrC family response regulator
MFALSEGDIIDASLLPSSITLAAKNSLSVSSSTSIPASFGRLDELERQAILDAIANAHGNISMAARTLGISRSMLYVKLAAIRAQPSSSSAGV